MRVFQPWYDRCLRWASHPHAQRYLVMMSTAEAIFFPIPPDVMLAPMCLARPQNAWRYALACTLASLAGALVGYALGWGLAAAIEPWLEQSHYADAYVRVKAAFAEYGVVYLLVAGFSPIPFKLFTVSAGLLRMPLLPFAGAVLVGRAARFFLVAGLIRWLGPKVAEPLRQWIDWLGWLTVIVAIIAVLIWR